MKLRLKSAIAGAATLAIVGGGIAGLAAPAFATAPPWNPDPNSNGRVVLYDASGHVLTGGTNLAHIADYAVASTGASPSNATKATLYFATPKNGQPTGAWPSDVGSGTSTFPSASNPAPLTGPAFANPVVKLGSSDGSLTDYIASYPNTDTTTSGYVGVYQIRLTDGGPGILSDGKYWESDVLVDTTNGTWTLIDPALATTVTSISATPVGPQVTGTSVTLNSTVTPAENGTISFFDGTTQVGAAQAVTTSSPSASVSAGAPAIGTHPFSAVFTPAGGTLVQGSTSTTLSYVITAPVIGTTTALSVNPGTVAQYGALDLTSNVSSSDSLPAGQAGSVQFFANGSSLGTVATNDGTVGEYKLHLASVTFSASATPYQITATFTPTSNAYGSSTSPQEPLTVTAASCPGSPVAGASCTDTQNLQVTATPGSLTITTPYTATNPFVLPNLVLNAGGTVLSSSARFPAASDPEIVVTSTLAGDPNWTVSVSGTDLTDGASHSINGENVGLTAGHLDTTVSPAFPSTIGFTDIAAASGTTAGGTGLGVKGGPHQFAQSTGGGNGTASLYGTLTVTAPPQTAAGTYNGTITFSVA